MLYCLFKNRTGAAGVEFALVAPVFFALVFCIIEVGYKTLIQSELDRITFSSTMEIARTSDAGISRADYKQNIVCGSGKLILIRCDRLLVGADAFGPSTPIGPHIFDPFIERWNTGCAGSTVVLELMYPVDNLIFNFAVADIVEHAGQRHFRGRGIVRREPMAAGTGTVNGDVPC